MNNLYLIVGIIVLVCLIAVAISAVGRARSLALQDDPMVKDELSEFQQMRDEGKISEEEYHRLKKVVSDQTLEKIKGQ